VGNVYKLAASLYNNALIVEKDNVVIDGGGFSLQGQGSESTSVAINLTCTNATVRNFYITGWQVGVLGVWDNNTISANYFTNNGLDVAIYANDYKITGNQIGAERIVGNNNIISQNQITLRDYDTGFWITSSSGTVIAANNVTLSIQTTTFISANYSDFKVYHNNFLNIEKNTGGAFVFAFNPNLTVDTFPWDNGYPSGGNYWSDYSSRYPNATEIDNSGIGNTSYVSNINPNVVDRYPLIAPFKLSESTIPIQQNPNPSSSPSPSPSPTPSPTIPEFPSWIILVFVFAIFVSLAVLKAKKPRFVV
jgi:hypothetical protein